MQRKLAAIMVADFVGSTFAMETDEEKTVERGAACMRAIGEIVPRHEGLVESARAAGIPAARIAEKSAA